jgi:hypothetical protein
MEKEKRIATNNPKRDPQPEHIPSERINEIKIVKNSQDPENPLEQSDNSLVNVVILTGKRYGTILFFSHQSIID